MNKRHLEDIRIYLVDNIFRNYNAMYDDNIRYCRDDFDKPTIDLASIIASLYNLLHYEVTGEKYEYMFHWANKIGSNVDDKYLDK